MQGPELNGWNILRTLSLKMEAESCSKTSVIFYQTTLYLVQVHNSLYNLRLYSPASHIWTYVTDAPNVPNAYLP